MSFDDKKIALDVVRYLDDKARAVKFSAEEIAMVLDDVAWSLGHRYRDTEPVRMEDWYGRLLSELMISKDRKAYQEHGAVDLVEHYALERPKET